MEESLKGRNLAGIIPITGREDKLVYRSCTVDPNIVVDVNKDYYITDKTYNRNYF